MATLTYSYYVQIREEFRLKVRNDYIDRYADLEKFTRKVDELGKHQRKIHWKIQNLEDTCAGNVKKFRKKLGRLRLKTFKNLRVGEKLMFQDKRLKGKFVKQVLTRASSLLLFETIISTLS